MGDPDPSLRPGSVTGMAACSPSAVNRTICGPAGTAVYDVADPKASRRAAAMAGADAVRPMAGA